MNKLKKSLTCSFCFKIYKEPIELPCEDNICKEHLKENDVVKTNKIKCPTCKLEFQVKGNEFKSNKLIQKLIKNQVFLNEEEITLKKNIEESIKVFYEMYDEFISSKNGLDLDCHEHFQEIRFQIDLHREKLKEKIDVIYMEIIEQTKRFEASYLKRFLKESETSLKPFVIKNVNEKLNALEETFRDPNLLIESIQEINLKHKESIDTIQSNLNEMTRIEIYLKSSNEFQPLRLSIKICLVNST